MYASGSYHEPRVHRTPHYASQRIPCPLIKPIQKIIEPMFYHICGRSVIKPENWEVSSFRKHACYVDFLTMDRIRELYFQIL